MRDQPAGLDSNEISDSEVSDDDRRLDRVGSTGRLVCLSNVRPPQDSAKG